jgi:Oxidoreductase family, NAD-binding Rossmann fold
MIRVGVIGTDNTHAYPYVAFLNGWDEDVPIPCRQPSGNPVPAMYGWALLLRQLETVGRVPSEEARVTRLWSGSAADAELIARACRITTVCSTPEQVSEDVDAVMVLSEDPRHHLEHARPALQRGLVVYIDKPLADSVDAGELIFELAANSGAVCFTCSSLRFAPETAALKFMVGNVLDSMILGAYVQVPLGVDLYGIHAVEIVNAIMGRDVDVVHGMQSKDRQTVHLRFRDGRTACVENVTSVQRPMENVIVNGVNRDIVMQYRRQGEIPWAFVQEFVGAALSRSSPVSADESLALLRLTTAMRKALTSAQTIAL